MVRPPRNNSVDDAEHEMAGRGREAKTRQTINRIVCQLRQTRCNNKNEEINVYRLFKEKAAPSNPSTATQVEKWTNKQWEAAKKRWVKNKKKWADCRMQSREQNLKDGRAGRLHVHDELKAIVRRPFQGLDGAERS
jgi:hypothetical protein